MAGNSQRRGAMRNDGTKKGATVGSGGQRRKQLKGRGPTPKATERTYHPAARRERAAVKRAEEGKERAPASARRRTAREEASMLIGRNPVVEALRAKVPAKALYVQVKMESDDRWREALRLAVAFNIPVLEVSHTDMDRLTDGGVHQGLALAVPAYDYADLTDVSTGSLLVALDGVTDPRNLGAIVRSAAAFGADGVVIPSRRGRCRRRRGQARAGRAGHQPHPVARGAAAAGVHRGRARGRRAAVGERAPRRCAH